MILNIPIRKFKRLVTTMDECLNSMKMSKKSSERETSVIEQCEGESVIEMKTSKIISFILNILDCPINGIASTAL